METIYERIKKISKPASSVKHNNRIVKVITRADIAELNSSLALKIEQNKRERKASWYDARDKIVKSNLASLENKESEEFDSTSKTVSSELEIFKETSIQQRGPILKKTRK